MGGVDLIQLPCKHAFHSTCLKTWLNAKFTCPVCRHRIDTSDGWETCTRLRLVPSGNHETHRLESNRSTQTRDGFKMSPQNDARETWVAPLLGDTLVRESCSDCTHESMY